MAIAFPLPWESFGALLNRREMDFWLDEFIASEETGGGGYVRVAYGDPMWNGSITLGANVTDNPARIVALLNLVRRPDASFMLCPPNMFPQDDPDGEIVRGYTPRIGNVLSDGSAMQIVGLPPRYSLRAGDFFSFEYGVPARHALHQVTEDARAGQQGVINGLSMTPYIRPGVAVGNTSVRLRRPRLKAIVETGSYSGLPYRIGHQGGGSFGWKQVLK